MQSRNRRKPRKQDLHFLNDEGMVACNPSDREAAHRAQVEGIATDNPQAVTCKKCWAAIRTMGKLRPSQTRHSTGSLTSQVNLRFGDEMKKIIFPWFVNPCLDEFKYLGKGGYGFDPPVVEQIGRECFIRYTKGNRIVSIAYEPGSPPIVELFTPTHEIKNRRIPRLNTGIVNATKWRDTGEDELRRILRSQAKDLEIKEKAFLSGE